MAKGDAVAGHRDRGRLLVSVAVVLLVAGVAVELGRGGVATASGRSHAHLTTPAGAQSSSPVTVPTTSPTSPPTTSATSSSTTGSTSGLVRWHGPVEGLFFHPLVLRPRLAFRDDRLGHGFQDYFVTAREFRAILDQLWRNGWTLVDAHRAATGHVWVPVGRKPLVLSEDDVNYYRYFEGHGLARRLVLDSHGAVLAEVRDRNGTHLSTQDLVPLVEAEVSRHPEFSAQGAKGVLAETGYEGLFGEHRLDAPAARARVSALAGRLRETGWTLASHTYGHIDLTHTSLAGIRADTLRWQRLAEPLLGRVDVLIYPFGARPTSAGVRLLREEGYRVQLDIDVRARRVLEHGVVVMSRWHVDGLAFDGHPRELRPFFDVGQVRDPRRP
jgi:hypothetical protein